MLCIVTDGVTVWYDTHVDRPKVASKLILCSCLFFSDY